MAIDTRVIRRAFNAGEISRNTKWRNDLEKHSYACETLENFYVDILGGISRRGGTRLLSVLGTSEQSDNVRLVPFDFNRNLSYVLAFYTSPNERDTWTYSSGGLDVQPPFSVCLKMPSNFGVGDTDFLNLFSLGNFYFGFDCSTRKLRLSWDNGNALSSEIDSAAHDIVLVCDGTNTRVYDGLNKILETDEPSFTDFGKGIIFPSATRAGDRWGLRVFDFDISENGAFYSISDFAEGKDEAGMLAVSPQYGAQTSLYGSYLSDGVLCYDWATAKQKRLTEIQAHYNGYAADIDALRAKIANEEISLSDLNSQISDCERYINSYESSPDGLDENVYLQKKQLLLTLQNQENSLLQQIASDKQALRNLWATAYGFGNWTDFVGATYPNAEDRLYEGTFVFPVKTVGEVVSIPFDVPKGSEISYAADSENVSVKLGDDEIAVGKVAKSYSVLKIAFALTEAGGVSLSVSHLSAEFHSLLRSVEPNWTRNRVVKLSTFDVNGGSVCNALATPIPSDALNEFQFKQVGGDIYIVHSSIAPQRISVGDGSFAFCDAVGIEPSLTTVEKDLCLSSANGTGDSCFYAGDIADVSANKDYFSADMVGSQFKIDYIDSVSHTYKWKFDSTGACTSHFPACGEITVRPQGGVWDGILILEESSDGGKTFTEIGRTTSIQGSDNTSFSREIYNINSVARCRLLEQKKVSDTASTKVESSTEGCFFNISRNSVCSAWVKILAVNSPTSATVKYLNPARTRFSSSAVYRSCWSEKFGYPRTVDIHEERLALGGNSNQPATIWLSQTNKWDNFRSVSNLDTDPLAYTLASDDGEPISWIVSKNDIMVGMGSSEWSLGSRDSSQSLTSSIVRASNQSEDGVEYIMPAKAGNMVIYVRRGGLELGSIAYDFASDAYNTVSLTTMCPDIFGSGVKTIFNQLSPFNRIWVVRKDGVVALFSYDRENNVAAWGKMLFGGGVFSACAVSTGRFKSVFFAVNRDGYVCLERLDPNESGTDNWLDCVPISENTKIPDGLRTSVAYVSKVKTMPFFVEGKIKVNSLTFYMLSSMGGRFRTVGFNSDGEEKCGQWQDFHFSEDEVFAENRPVRDFRYRGYVNLEPLEEAAAEVESDYPAPFNLCAIAAKI